MTLSDVTQATPLRLPSQSLPPPNSLPPLRVQPSRSPFAIPPANSQAPPSGTPHATLHATCPALIQSHDTSHNPSTLNGAPHATPDANPHATPHAHPWGSSLSHLSKPQQEVNKPGVQELVVELLPSPQRCLDLIHALLPQLASEVYQAFIGEV